MITTARLDFPRLLGFALFFLAFSLTLDLVSTYFALSSGRAYEGNPLAAHLLLSGFGSLILVKLLGFGTGLIMAVLIVRSKHLGLIQLYTASLLTIALFYFLLSLSNFAAAYYGHDFFTSLLRYFRP